MELGTKITHRADRALPEIPKVEALRRQRSKMAFNSTHTQTLVRCLVVSASALGLLVCLWRVTEGWWPKWCPLPSPNYSVHPFTRSGVGGGELTPNPGQPAPAGKLARPAWLAGPVHLPETYGLQATF